MLRRLNKTWLGETRLFQMVLREFLKRRDRSDTRTVRTFS